LPAITGTTRRESNVAKLREYKSKPCPYCGKVTTVTLDSDKVARWVVGENIQHVWPEMSATERETLITGMCSDECWNKYLGPEPE
jgi:hypothetical protein